ncbi:MAG: hypothetical protein IKY16_07035 [Bacteroidales bacterium]|nr:hypothetical protein [Bacteroidales bacterium]
MSKIIRMTEDHRNELRKDFEKTLADLKLSDGKVSFTKVLGTIDRKATVVFSDIAWFKTQTLVREFDKEVAWHGLARRSDNPEKDEYYISDILVYPQEVTGTTVNTDQERYEKWLMSHDDETFNSIRMQGHSHVNMGITPSSVDTSYYDRILDQLEDDMFYIFMIFNKRGEKTVKIYDMQKNVLFETADVTIEVENTLGIGEFLRDAKESVRDKVYTSSNTSKGAQPVGTYHGYGGYNNYSASSGSKNTPAATQQTVTNPVSTASKQPVSQSSSKTENKPAGKGKGKRVPCKNHSGKETQKKVPISSAYPEDDEIYDIYETYYGGRYNQ